MVYCCCHLQRLFPNDTVVYEVLDAAPSNPNAAAAAESGNPDAYSSTTADDISSQATDAAPALQPHQRQHLQVHIFRWDCSNRVVWALAWHCQCNDSRSCSTSRSVIFTAVQGQTSIFVNMQHSICLLIVEMYALLVPWTGGPNLRTSIGTPEQQSEASATATGGASI